MREVLASPDKDANGTNNSKRVDFALMEESAQVRHAIEYQCSGHDLPGTAPVECVILGRRDWLMM